MRIKTRASDSLTSSCIFWNILRTSLPLYITDSNQPSANTIHNCTYINAQQNSRTAPETKLKTEAVTENRHNMITKTTERNKSGSLVYVTFKAIKKNALFNVPRRTIWRRDCDC